MLNEMQVLYRENIKTQYQYVRPKYLKISISQRSTYIVSSLLQIKSKARKPIDCSIMARAPKMLLRRRQDQEIKMAFNVIHVIEQEVQAIGPTSKRKAP